tara:strand:+ start:399 stop:617 length:219 start_codon:yes stop_codon:yes gene_type:complete
MIMRCISCNTLLTDYEITRKYKSTGAYIDLCVSCGAYIGEVELDDRKDLKWLIDEVPEEMDYVQDETLFNAK